MYRKTIAFVDLDAILHNYSLASRLAPKSKCIAVIKAEAYGHGMLRVAEALQSVVPAFAVAIVDEALKLRAAGISRPILVLEGANDAKSCETAAANALSLVVHNQEQVSQLLTASLSGKAMTLRSEIIAIRDVPAGESVGYGARWTARRPAVIGTVAADYADGYPRQAPNGTPTMVNNQAAPLVGAVSMDMLSIDLTDHNNASIGDAVVLWGKDVPVNEVASRCGTIGYELITGVSARVPRTYTP